MRRLAFLALLVSAACLWPVAANASTPCRNRIYNDWYGDGKIATTYPISCYRDALKHVRPDAAIYSSLIGDIKSAMQGALERKHGDKKIPAEIGRGLASVDRGGVKGNEVTLHPSQDKNAKNANGDPPTTTSTKVASGPGSSSGGGVPTPIIVLGAIALLLAAVGGIGSGYRYFHRKR